MVVVVWHAVERCALSQLDILFSLSCIIRTKQQGSLTLTHQHTHTKFTQLQQEGETNDRSDQMVER